jgi:hypothetical protein
MHESRIGRLGRSTRAALLAALVLATSAVFATAAQATVLIQNHSDPAGSDVSFPFHLDRPSPLAPIDFLLKDGQTRSFGPMQGVVVATALPPRGWQVADIRCVGPSMDRFAIDIPAGRVTIQHGLHDESICSFTQRQVSAPTGPGVSPQPPDSALRKLPRQRKAALVAVFPGRRRATMRVTIVRRSILRTTMTWRHHVVAISRVVRRRGVYDVTLHLPRRSAVMLRRNGHRRTIVQLRMVVKPRRGATSVFRHRVIVPL